MTASTRSARMISGPQLRKLHALYRELGITDRTQRLADIGRHLGNAVESSSDLTLDEAKVMIDHLEQRTQARPA